jgi:hypothetical protein
LCHSFAQRLGADTTLARIYGRERPWRRADELAAQIGEWLVANPDLTIADVRAAISRRFGEPS